MKICGISDIHGILPTNIPECEVLCIAGDIVPLKIQRDTQASKDWFLKDFCNWVKGLPCSKVIFTAGNHDFFLYDVYKYGDYFGFVAELENNSNDKAILLIDELYKYKGIKFYGFPYIRPIMFQEGRWAFEDDYKGIDKPSIYDSLIDKDIDVLITHDSPMKNNCLDNAIERMHHKPKTFFYGHWHEGASDIFQGMYNCSIINNRYSIKENFEIPTVYMNTRESMIEEIFSIMIDNIPIYTALKGYDNFQVNAIKEYLQLNKEFFLKQQEDEIPLPVTGEEIEEDEKDEN